MRDQLMNFHIDYVDDKKRIKTHPLLLPKIESGTKGEEIKKKPVGDSMKSNNTELWKTQAVDGNGLHKAADKFIS